MQPRRSEASAGTEPYGTAAYAKRVERLRRRLRRLGELAVAFSGGVDSSVLLHAAVGALGARAVGVIADSPSLPRHELADAQAFASAIGARLVVLRTRELDDPDYVANAGRRCYFCKRALFDEMTAWVDANGHAHLAFGEIVDDLSDDRPGALAARERGVSAPLREAGFTKADVRRYAREHGLAVAEKPASACLASRIPMGTPVTAANLARVERAEAAVRALGFRVLRVRDHGARARVEVGTDELDEARRREDQLASVLAPLGFERLELAAYGAPALAV